MAVKVSTAMVGTTMRVTVKGTTDRETVRGLARKAAGTAAVGRPEEVKPGTWHVVVSERALAARKVVGAVPPARTMREAAPADALTAVLASLDPAVAKVIRSALAQSAPVAAPSTFVADVIAPKAAKRAACKCATCRDFGVVRGAGERKGRPYTSAAGARGALAPATCPACKGKSTAALSA